MALSRTTRLRRAAELEMSLVGDRLSLRCAGQTLECSSLALGLLEAFSEPCTLERALARAAASGRTEWLALVQLTHELLEIGALHDADDSRARVAASSGYAGAALHASMLDDRVRTESYLAALERVVVPDDVVVDLGAGTGVLALGAHRAGARRVFAVERSAIAGCARAMFEANGARDIELLSGHSTAIELPEPATVLVAELLGDDPLGEQLLEQTIDARDRWLAAGARLIPRRVRLRVRGVTLDRETLETVRFEAGPAERWQRWYGFDFSPLVAAARPAVHHFLAKRQRALRWTSITADATAFDLDLGQVAGCVVESRTVLAASQSVRLDAIAGYFEAELADGLWLSSDPLEGETHWRSPTWLLAEGLALDPGDRVELSYLHNGFGSTVAVQRVAD